MSRRRLCFVLLAVLNVALLAACVWWGSVRIPAADVWAILTGGEASDAAHAEAWRFILLQSRVPAALTAALTGAALGVCGLLLQSFFRNPLAGPSVLGITSGAHLAVALAMLAGVTAAAGLVAGALAGALAVTLLLLAVARLVRQPITLLVVGILVGYVVSAVITLLSYGATADGLQAFVVWGMGNFAGVGADDLPIYAASILAGLALAFSLIRPLNAWMLGADYARSLGFRPGPTRSLVLVATSLLAAVTTAWCGPIAFIGISIPHVARLLMRSDDHFLLLPASALCGAALATLCLLLSALPPSGRLLPVNALTPLFGVPIVIYVLLRR